MTPGVIMRKRQVAIDAVCIVTRAMGPSKVQSGLK